MRVKNAWQIRHKAFLRSKYLWSVKLERARIPVQSTKSSKSHDINALDPSTFADATLSEIIAALEKDGKLRDISLGHEPALPNYRLHDPGVEKTTNSPGKPCEPAFLDAIVKDCCSLIWKFRRLYRNTDFNSMEDPLPTEYADIFRDLNTVFEQCRRLKKSPELFSTIAQEHRFMDQMSQIAEIVDNLRDIILLKNEGKLAKNAMREREKKLAKDLPRFHPGRADGKHPWTRWLENSSAVTPPGWIGIQQKIPHIGDNIIRRITTMYELYERQFRITKLIDSEVNDTLADFRAPGEPFEHINYSNFSTIGINHVKYRAGTMPRNDKNGIWKIEELTKAVQQSYGWQENPLHYGNENAPYHRFMMAYQIETLYHLWSR